MMKTYRSMLHAAVVALVLGIAGGAASAATIGFSPTAATGDPGDFLSFDIVVSDLGGEIVSAYDLDITFDASVLSASSVMFSTELGVALEIADLSNPGLVDMAAVSLMPDPALTLSQNGDSVVLGTIEFQVVSVGSTTLGFTFDAFNDIKGSLAVPLDITANPGSFRSIGSAPIPEPTAAVVFGAGMLIASAATRQWRS